MVCTGSVKLDWLSGEELLMGPEEIEVPGRGWFAGVDRDGGRGVFGCLGAGTPCGVWALGNGLANVSAVDLRGMVDGGGNG